MPKIRKDNKGRNLRPGETQRSDGNYMFVYMLGKKKKYIYDTDLAALRAKEKQLTKDADDGVRTQEAMKITLNDMFKVLMDTKLQLKASTRANYEYLWSSYIKDEPFANTPLPNIRKSDILTFYTKLLKKGFAINSLESINNLVHPALELAVDDDYIRKNPSKGVYRSLKSEGSGKPAKTRIALTKEQQKNFLRFISKSPMYSHWLPVMVVLLGTGLRVGECTGLTKNDVELPDGTTAILEIKTTNYNAKDHWWLNGEETVPVYYETQGRHYMAVMNVDRCFFCCLYGNNEEETIIREIRRDEAYEDEMIFLEQHFWENYVLAKTPPPYTEEGNLVIESVRRHTGPADKDAPVVTFDYSLTAKLMRYLQLQEEKKHAEKNSKEIDADMQRLKGALIAEMGKSCKAICQQDGVNYTVTYNPVRKPSIDKDNLDRLKLDHPDIYEQYVTISEFRRFSVKADTKAA